MRTTGYLEIWQHNYHPVKPEDYLKLGVTMNEQIKWVYHELRKTMHIQAEFVVRTLPHPT